MKKTIFLMLAATIVLATALTSCSIADDPVTNPSGETTDKARLTIIYYGTIGQDNDNTAEDMWKTAQQMLKEHKDVRMTVCWKYAKPDYFGGQYAKPGDLVMFELTDTTDLSKIGENYAQNKPDQAMYDEQLLTDYINFAAKKAPAEKYCLWLYGHGAGFDITTDYEKDLRKPGGSQTRGVLYDEWFPVSGNMARSDALNMYELMRGIYYSEIPHFDLILLYDCLMGNLETLYDLNIMADYMITAEHALPMNNIPSTEFLMSLGKNKDLETACREGVNNIPKTWDDTHHIIFVDWNGDFKLIKCDEMTKLLEPASALASRLQELYPTMQAQLDTAVVHTYQVINQLEFYDFADYAHKVAEQTGDPQLQEISQKIDEAFDEMILARREVHGGTYGDLPKFSLSFILKNQESYEQQTLWGYTFEEGYQYTNWHLLTDWGKWLKMNQQAPKDQKNKVLGQPVGQAL